jgi:tRNA(Ile)-lysidine synthase
MRPHESGAVRLERPLLKVSRAALRATLEAAGHPWIEDPSNADDRFERVRLRKAQPTLDALGLTPQAIARSAGRLERALTALERMASDFIARHVELRPEGFAVIELAAFRRLDDEIAIEALERLLAGLGGSNAPPRLIAVEALLRWLKRGESQARTLGGCRIALRKSHFLIGREAGRIREAPVAITPRQSVTWDNRFMVSIRGTDLACAIVPARGLALARNRDIPAFVQDSLPAIMAKGEIVAVPSLGVVGVKAPPGLQAEAEFQKIGL